MRTARQADEDELFEAESSPSFKLPSKCVGKVTWLESEAGSVSCRPARSPAPRSDVFLLDGLSALRASEWVFFFTGRGPRGEHLT